MDRRKLLTAGGAALAAAAAAPAALAEGGSDQGLVGSWYGTITAVNPPLGTFNNLISFHEGGVVIESRRYLVPVTPFGPLLETTGHGAWERVGNRRYESFFRFLLQSDNDGAPIGTDNIRLLLTLAGDTLTGTFQSQVKDLTGAVLITVTGTFSATRIEV